MKKSRKKKHPARNFLIVSSIVIVLALAIFLVFSFSRNQSIVTYNSQCSVPSCPSGYSSMGITCDTTNSLCTQTCQKTTPASCGSFGSYSSFGGVGRDVRYYEDQVIGSGSISLSAGYCYNVYSELKVNLGGATGGCGTMQVDPFSGATHSLCSGQAWTLDGATRQDIPPSSGSYQDGASGIFYFTSGTASQCPANGCSMTVALWGASAPYLPASTQTATTQCSFAGNVSTIPIPTNPVPPSDLFVSVLATLKSWINSLLQAFGLQSITNVQGNATNVVNPNSVQTYSISVIAPTPNGNYSGGNYSIQYANWALTDSGGNALQQGTWVPVNGSYSQNVTITTPNNLGNYVLVGVIYQYDMYYNFTSNAWINTNSTVVAKEAYNLQTRLPVPSNPIPSSALSWFQNILNTIWNFIKSLFGL